MRNGCFCLVHTHPTKDSKTDVFGGVCGFGMSGSVFCLRGRDWHIGAVFDVETGTLVLSIKRSRSPTGGRLAVFARVFPESGAARLDDWCGLSLRDWHIGAVVGDVPPVQDHEERRWAVVGWRGCVSFHGITSVSTSWSVRGRRGRPDPTHGFHARG
jgi:hypothetical protein